MGLKLSPKQNEYIREAQYRLNFKIGAVRSGKSFVDVVYMIPKRIRSVSDKEYCKKENPGVGRYDHSKIRKQIIIESADGARQEFVCAKEASAAFGISEQSARRKARLNLTDECGRRWMYGKP